MKHVHTYTVRLEPAEEGGYVASVPALPGCLTQGDSYEQTLATAREAIACYLEGLTVLGKAIPVEPQYAAEVRLDISVPAHA
jgi:predicted RNase H-like HicB family nuclease